MTEQQQPASTDKKKSWFVRHKILTAVLALVAVFVVAGVAGGEEPQAQPETAAGSTGGAEEKVAEEKEPEPEPKPEPKLTPKQQVAEAVADTVDGAEIEDWSRRGKSVVVTFPVNDNLTSGMIRSGAHSDTLAILIAVAGTDAPVRDIGVRGTFPLVDKYGNESPGQVLWSYWAKAWRGVDWGKDDIEYLIEVPEAADVYFAHPDLRE
jgi:hypothetical protein